MPSLNLVKLATFLTDSQYGDQKKMSQCWVPIKNPAVLSFIIAKGLPPPWEDAQCLLSLQLEMETLRDHLFFFSVIRFWINCLLHESQGLLCWCVGSVVVSHVLQRQAVYSLHCDPGKAYITRNARKTKTPPIGGESTDMYRIQSPVQSKQHLALEAMIFYQQ